MLNRMILKIPGIVFMIYYIVTTFMMNINFLQKKEKDEQRYTGIDNEDTVRIGNKCLII